MTELTEAQSNDTNVEIQATAGYSGVAAILTEMFGHDIYRQLVWKWWTRRERNGFPAGQVSTTGEGHTFSVNEVVSWYRAHIYKNRNYLIKTGKISEDDAVEPEQLYDDLPVPTDDCPGAGQHQEGEHGSSIGPGSEHDGDH